MRSVTSNTSRATTVLHALGGIVCLLLFSLLLFGQASGRVLRAVTDQSGALTAGAKVAIIDTQSGVARTLTTDRAGEDTASNPIPARYTVRVEAQGFQVLNRENVELEVGKEVRVDLLPRSGQENQSIAITEAVPLVDTASAALGGTLRNNF